jgi:hypothetical protein
MDLNTSPEPPQTVLPYETPELKKKTKGMSVNDTLGLTIFCCAGAAVLLFLIGGANAATASATACLCAVAIAFGHFLTRR